MWPPIRTRRRGSEPRNTADLTALTSRLAGLVRSAKTGRSDASYAIRLTRVDGTEDHLVEYET